MLMSRSRDLVRVRVAAIFEERGAIRPVWFAREGEEPTRVGRVCYRWDEAEGAAKIVCLSVELEGGSVTLRYNTKDQTWLLQETVVEQNYPNRLGSEPRQKVE